MKISNIKDKCITLGSIAVLVAVMYFFQIPCPFKAFFDIPCPGCGMTRAYISLLHLELERAFEFNQMFWSVPVLLVFYLSDGRIFKTKWMNTLLCVLIFLGFFVSWIFKLVLL